MAWARNMLKDRGLIHDDSKRGIWELTTEGIEKAKQYGTTQIPPVVADLDKSPV